MHMQGLNKKSYNPQIVKVVTNNAIINFTAMVSYNIVVGDTVTKVIIRLLDLDHDSFFG